METQDKTFFWNQGLLKKNNVVYHRTNKCAGTYLFNLLKRNAWKEINYYEIEKQDINFGFIIDPYVRRAKAITERIYMSGMMNSLDDNFIKFIEDNCICDEHLIPYHVQFKNIDLLHLFPILPNFNILEILQNFLKNHNIEIQEIHVDKNASQPNKITVYNKVYKSLKWGVFEYIFQKDIKLYNKILKEFINTYK